MFTKESIKQFLKPDWRKVLIFVIVAFILSQLQPIGYAPDQGIILRDGRRWQADEISPIGFPIQWYHHGEWGSYIVYVGLLIDLIIWYFISCLLISAWDKIRKKSAV